MSTMPGPTTTKPDERERFLIDAVVALAKSLREERDALARRLRQLERELSALLARVDHGAPPDPRDETDTR